MIRRILAVLVLVAVPQITSARVISTPVMIVQHRQPVNKCVKCHNLRNLVYVGKLWNHEPPVRAER